jgi:CYTH domain-containing protein
MIELERTFLAKHVPPDITNYPSKEVIDIYIPKTAHHPVLRIRKNGDKYEITKKYPVKEGDSSEQHEFTIPLTPEEFAQLSSLDGKKVHKIRYFYPVNNHTAEVDVFQGALKGLVIIDFEFSTAEEKEAFTPPDFCGPDITQETFVAGGMVCGKSYEDIEGELKRFDYYRL